MIPIPFDFIDRRPLLAANLAALSALIGAAGFAYIFTYRGTDPLGMSIAIGVCCGIMGPLCLWLALWLLDLILSWWIGANWAAIRATIRPQGWARKSIKIGPFVLGWDVEDSK